MEGITCDTFTLTIAGAPADWVIARKLVHVHLGWTIQAQDFDLYIHKGDLTGPVVANSGNGITNGVLLKEDADLDPAKSNVGTGVFAVHVVYWTATAADQYQAGQRGERSGATLAEPRHPHQALSPRARPNPVYPNGVWYGSQSIADAVCSLSLDGGMTFGPAVPKYSLADCGGLHGHIKVGPDGTAYVPNRSCHGDPSSLVHVGGKPALLVSEDNGISWQIRTLEQATTKPDRDPSVAVGSDGTVYFAYQAGDGHSRVAVSPDKD